MGNYNPHAPRILGMEWVPIRDEDQVFAPAQHLVEVGHSFPLTTSSVLRDGRFYINEQPAGLPNSQVMMMGVYPAGREALSGPVRSVIVPVNSGLVTGGTFTGSASVAEALLYTADFKAVFNNIPPPSAIINIDLKFATLQYLNALVGKRILGVDFLYTALMYKSLGDENDLPTIEVSLGTSFPSTTTRIIGFLEPSLVSDQVMIKGVRRLRLGEVDWFWQNQNTSRDMMPWSPTRLMAFDSGQPTSRKIHIASDVFLDSQVFELHYAALEIFFCEEQRVAVGGANFAGTLGRSYLDNMNYVNLRGLDDVANPVLAPGNYTVYVSSANQGDQVETILSQQASSAATFPTVSALRELYSIPPHPGVQVELTTEVGKVFTKEQVHVLPQISLHTSGGPITDVHVYGRQAVSQVWGAKTVIQEIYDGIVGGTATYPQVRFYARRFGDTTQPLVLTGTGSIATSSVSITPAEFDALEPIVDGWAEVTLRFANPPVMGALVAPEPSWEWSSAAETAGNRWEILAASAPALSGVPGNLLNLVPAQDQLYLATYQPPAGAIAELTWMPQGVGSPWVSGSTVDDSSDAVIIFAQDMPAVTGFAVSIQTQPVSGIGQECGLDPCGIPTGIDYNLLTWTATSSGTVPVSGFGYYEMQRMDTVDVDWQTIMKSTSVTGASFKDYEARIGLLSSYRIRAVDVYEFAGPWSSTVTSTITAPGLDGSCLEDAHVLVFTSNERQDGSVNLAYSTAWEGRIEEEFAFPEAGFTQLQPMYNRDYFTAFRPRERGGEQFARTLLVQAAAISPPTLGDFRSLRDMAWEDTSYICVRDEDGNRWLSTVLVPGGRAMNKRKIYLTEVQIVEVTATPSPVDPYA